MAGMGRRASRGSTTARFLWSLALAGLAPATILQGAETALGECSATDPSATSQPVGAVPMNFQAMRGRALLQTAAQSEAMRVSSAGGRLRQLLKLAQDPAASRTLLALDKNGDQHVDEAEVRAFAEMQGLDSKKAVKAFSQLDADGDGLLNMQELGTALSSGGPMGPGSPGAEATPAMAAPAPEDASRSPDVAGPRIPLEMSQTSGHDFGQTKTDAYTNAGKGAADGAVAASEENGGQLSDKISDSELAAAKTLAVLDQNQDARVDETELTEFAMGKGVDPQKTVKAFMALDHNEDGQLNVAELGGLSAALVKHGLEEATPEELEHPVQQGAGYALPTASAPAAGGPGQRLQAMPPQQQVQLAQQPPPPSQQIQQLEQQSAQDQQQLQQLQQQYIPQQPQDPQQVQQQQQLQQRASATTGFEGPGGSPPEGFPRGPAEAAAAAAAALGIAQGPAGPGMLAAALPGTALESQAMQGAGANENMQAPWAHLPTTGLANSSGITSDEEDQIWAMVKSDPKLEKLIENGVSHAGALSNVVEGLASNLSGSEGERLQSVAKDLEMARRMDAEADQLEKKAAELRAEAASTARKARALAETAAARAVESKVRELVMQADHLDVEEKDVEVLAAKLTARSKVELHQANDYMSAADLALNASARNETMEASLLATDRW